MLTAGIPLNCHPPVCPVLINTARNIMSDNLVSDTPGAAPAAPAGAAAGPSRSRRPPWTAAAHRPAQPDGIFRVLLVSSGSVASIKVPLMVAALQKVGQIDVSRGG